LRGTVIVGGGPAGAAAAISLARAGHDATLIERSLCANDKVCGDFLSSEAVAMLEGFGIDLSCASTIHAVRLIHRHRVACAPLPFTARGLSRRALDEALLRRAAVHGATVLRGHRISGLSREAGRWRLESRSLGRCSAGTVCLASGKHDVRGAGRAQRGNDLLALKMYYALDARQNAELRHHVELVLFRGGYAGLQLIERDRAVLCALLRAETLRAVGGQWDNLIDALTDKCPHLRRRLAGALALLERPIAVAGLPYGFIHAPAAATPGLFRLGDQAAVIASLTGDGIALALFSGRLAAAALLAGDDGTGYHQELATRLSQQMRLATSIHRLCLWPASQPWVAAACGLLPGAVRAVASATRLTQFNSAD
jgi:flavin-dependent dehydrogenase